MTFEELRQRVLEDLGLESGPQLRYTRWFDRLWAVVVPSRRRRLRQMQRLVDYSAAEINALYSDTLADLAIYGTSLVLTDHRSGAYVRITNLSDD